MAKNVLELETRPSSVRFRSLFFLIKLGHVLLKLKGRMFLSVMVCVLYVSTDNF